jgi:hypothetical protein
VGEPDWSLHLLHNKKERPREAAQPDFSPGRCRQGIRCGRSSIKSQFIKNRRYVRPRCDSHEPVVGVQGVAAVRGSLSRQYCRHKIEPDRRWAAVGTGAVGGGNRGLDLDTIAFDDKLEKLQLRAWTSLVPGRYEPSAAFRRRFGGHSNMLLFSLTRLSDIGERRA